MQPDPQLTFRALSDPTRRSILTILAQRDMTIGEIADQFSQSRPAIKKHLIVLEQGNLISVSQRGRERVNTLIPNGFHPVTDWLSVFDVFWNNRLATLKSTIEKDLN